jgi:hypothetical protein
MKKFILLIISLLTVTLFATAQEQSTTKMRDVIEEGPIYAHEPETTQQQNKEAFYILLNSNIEYAQLGGGFIFKTTNMKPLFILNFKVSSDNLYRNFEVKTPQAYNSSRPFDVNEIIVTGSFLFNLTENISYWLGAGIFTGQMVQPKSLKENTWQPVDQSVGVHPVATCGVMLGKQRVKLLLGYDVAFVKPENYPTNQLNTKAPAKLTSATIGIAFKLGNT